MRADKSRVRPMRIRNRATREQDVDHRQQWRDPHKGLWLSGLIVPLTPFIAWGLVTLLGPGLFWAAGLLVIALIPSLDRFYGPDRTNPPDEVMKQLENSRYYRWCLFPYIPLQYAGLVLACYLWAYAPMGVPERIALATTVGVVGGLAINVAHELGHKRTSHEQWLSKIALAQTWYGHFYVEHNYGHHTRVATPDDPASARFGESFWRFWPRTVSGTFKLGSQIESKRLRRQGKSVWSLRNNVLNAWLMSALLYIVLIAVFGWSILPYLIIQAVFGFSFLEIANYIEHYGLLREKRPDGRYVRVAPHHSWNSDFVMSNALLYHVQRHSDHHAHAGRRYQTLRSFGDSTPQLPGGYVSMGACALIPPLWRRVIDKRLLAYYDGDVTRLNRGHVDDEAGPAQDAA